MLRRISASRARVRDRRRSDQRCACGSAGNRRRPRRTARHSCATRRADTAAAIGAARAGDTIVLDRGTYPGGAVVSDAKKGLTIRGVDRNAVVLDGGDRRRNGVAVHADDVSILNLSAHNFAENAFYWEDVDGFRSSYVTAWNVGGYGFYTEGSRNGVLDHDYVTGAADAAYYVGECKDCAATIEHVVARLSAVGYSGTNAAGVSIRDSLWQSNGAGIVPNSYANEKDPPEARATIIRNTVTGSGRMAVPIRTALAGFVGVGIAVAGGNANQIRDNRVAGSERYGVAIFSTAYKVSFDVSDERVLGPRWRPRANVVRGNTVTGSGRADLALASGARSGNCFRSNRAPNVRPAGLQQAACSGKTVGDLSVGAALEAPVANMVRATQERRDPPSYRSMPRPRPQANMPA
jgi:hypothetical protein